jgi:hypothetical protein
MNARTRHRQAGELLTALQTIQAHLTAYPVAVPVAVDVRTSGMDRTVSIMLDADELPILADDLLSWAAVLTDTTASLWRSTVHGTAHLSISGHTALNVAVSAYGTTDYRSDVFGDIPTGDTRPLTLDQLRAWAVSVEVQS